MMEPAPLSDMTESPRTIGEVVYSVDRADFHYMSVNVPCQSACPALTNIPAYIRCLFEGRYGRSYELNRIVNLFPGILGRVCSRPCESKCRHGEPELGRPVNICHIKRAAADFREAGHPYLERLFAPVGKNVCIVGAGPAGLAAAHDLAVLGFGVTMLEAFDEPGGMLRYGIPEFRLPRTILREEIESVLRIGIQLKTNVKVGRDVGMEGLLSSFDAVLVAAGCYVSRPLNIQGEILPGVFTGLQFVVDAASGVPPAVGNRVLVIGAGFTAFDCARTARRLGAKDVSICIRATEEDLRVTEEEIHETKLEGVRLRALMVSGKIVGTDKVQGVEFVRTALGERRADGRRDAKPISGSEFFVEADSVIVAVGQGAEPIPGPGDKDPRGVIIGDPQTTRASVPNLYVAGDFSTGPSTVIEAVANGRKAAEQIARDLMGKPFKEWAVRIEEARLTDRERPWDFIPRQDMPTVLPVEERFAEGSPEVELGLSGESAVEEAKRCYLCYLHYEIDIDRCIYCRYCIDSAPRDCIKLVEEVITNEDGAVVGFVETKKWQNVNAVVIDNSRCIRCGECVRVCPVDCISVSKVELVERPAHIEEV